MVVMWYITEILSNPHHLAWRPESWVKIKVFTWAQRSMRNGGHDIMVTNYLFAKTIEADLERMKCIILPMALTSIASR
jgi:hypothetical protein